jgi:hypothetical protein
MLTKPATAVAGALAVVLLLGYLFWHPLADDQDGSAKSDPAPPQAFDSAQQRNFAVLRGATQPVPGALRAELREVRNQSVRALRLNAAKYVQAGDGIWVANGRKDTCIIQAHGGAVSCVPRNVLFQRGVALGVADIGPQTDRNSREFAVYGIVPNQIKAIEVSIGNKKQRVPIRDNSYALRASEPILVKRFER